MKTLGWLQENAPVLALGPLIVVAVVAVQQCDARDGRIAALENTTTELEERVSTLSDEGANARVNWARVLYQLCRDRGFVPADDAVAQHVGLALILVDKQPAEAWLEADQALDAMAACLGSLEFDPDISFPDEVLRSP